MEKQYLEDAMAEAHRFIERAEKALDGFQWVTYGDKGSGFYRHNDTRDTAAVKRSSMDLTRALAKVRAR